MDSVAVTRLGKRELGRYAYEERMPERLLDLLAKEDDGNLLRGVIPKLYHLLSRDSEIEVAYLCTEAAIQIHKLPVEGPYFCGYRNMQMLCLTQPNNGLSKVNFSEKLSIPHLQQLIERAWSRGLNSHGRIQTGGIRETRKYVGTSEAQALLLSLDVPCTGNSFQGQDGWRKVLDHIELYLSNGTEVSSRPSGIIQTSRPPIFLQRPQHSVTIVGLERLRSGKRRILIFDPAWRPPSAMRGEVSGTGALGWKDLLLLRRYRRSERSLRRFNAFETLTIDR